LSASSSAGEVKPNQHRTKATGKIGNVFRI
jgi:hypothetical protein